MYACVGTTLAALHKQYSKCPPKILQERKIILKLKPETEQVSLSLSETCTYQHLESCFVQEDYLAVGTGLLMQSSQSSGTSLLLSTDVRSSICCDGREDEGWQLSSPCHISAVLCRLMTVSRLWIYVFETFWSWQWAVSPSCPTSVNHQKMLLSFVSKAGCETVGKCTGVWRHAMPGGLMWTATVISSISKVGQRQHGNFWLWYHKYVYTIYLQGYGFTGWCVPCK